MRVPAIDLVVPGDPATPTGGYIYDRRILQGLDALGWRSEVHSLDPSFPTPSRAALAHAESTFARIPTGRAVVIDGLALGGLAPLLAAEAHRLRLVALVHHPLADETGLEPAARDALRRAEQESLASVERIVVTSPWTARALAQTGISHARIRIVEPGTDPAVPDATRISASSHAALHTAGSNTDEPAAEPVAEAEAEPVAELEAEFVAAPCAAEGRQGALRFLCVATLTPRKGHALLIDALSLLRDRPWHLDCVGSSTRDAATADRVRRQIRALELEARVTLHGELPPAALVECYRRADVFVLSSYLEGYGMALADAVAHGLPIVSTTAGAIPQTVPPQASILVPPGDRSALAAALSALMDDGDLVRRLAASALIARGALPTWPEAAAKFAAAIADLAGRPSAAGAGA